jgi:hypothetical protein
MFPGLNNMFSGLMIFLTKHFMRVLLSTISIVLPIQIVFLIISFFVGIFPGIPLEVQVIAFFTLLSLAQIPFIYLSVQVIKDQYVTFSDIYNSFLKNILTVFGIAFFLSIGIYIGFSIYFVIGIVLFVFSFPIAYTVVIEKAQIRRAVSLSFDRFFEVFTLLCVYMFVETSLWWLISNGLNLITDHPFIFMLMRMVLDSILLPLYTFCTTHFYIHWIDDQDEIYSEDYELELRTK